MTRVVILLHVNHVISNATGRKYYIRRDRTCSTPNVVYMAYCKKCKNQDVGPQFHGNRDHVTIKVISKRMFVLARLQRILLMNVVMRKYLAFVIDVVNNTSGLTRNQIEDLLLEKEKFWIGTSSNTTPGIK